MNELPVSPFLSSLGNDACVSFSARQTPQSSVTPLRSTTTANIPAKTCYLSSNASSVCGQGKKKTTSLGPNTRMLLTRVRLQ